MRIHYVLGLVACCVLPSTLRAQTACPVLAAGSTIRLQSAFAPAYNLPAPVAATDTSIVLPPAGGLRARTVRCADLGRVELRLGTESRTRSALRGAGLGLLLGAVAGAGIGYAGWEESPEFQLFSRGESTALGAGYFGGIGLAAGGLIGYLAPGSRWREVPLTTHESRAPAAGLRITPAGGSRVRVAYTLPL